MAWRITSASLTPRAFASSRQQILLSSLQIDLFANHLGHSVFLSGLDEFQSIHHIIHHMVQFGKSRCPSEVMPGTGKEARVATSCAEVSTRAMFWAKLRYFVMLFNSTLPAISRK